MSKEKSSEKTEEQAADEAAIEEESSKKKLAEMSLEELADLDRQLAETNELLMIQRRAVTAEVDRRHILLLNDTASKWSRARYPEADKADPVPEEVPVG